MIFSRKNAYVLLLGTSRFFEFSNQSYVFKDINDQSSLAEHLNISAFIASQ